MSSPFNIASFIPGAAKMSAVPGVSTGPGLMLLARMPSGPPASAMQCVMAMTAALVVVWAIPLLLLPWPATEAVFSTTPPRSDRYGQANFVT